MTTEQEAAPQITRDDLKKMTAAEIVAARKAGQLDNLLNRKEA